MTATEPTPRHLDSELAQYLCDVLDPEIGLNIVDLGLVRSATRLPDAIEVRMTLTSRACPLGQMLVSDVRQRLEGAYPAVARVNVKLVWEPLWSPDFITDRGYELLGRARTGTLI